jgi:hypothetical protein
VTAFLDAGGVVLTTSCTYGLMGDLISACSRVKCVVTSVVTPPGPVRKAPLQRNSRWPRSRPAALPPAESAHGDHHPLLIRPRTTEFAMFADQKACRRRIVHIRHLRAKHWQVFAIGDVLRRYEGHAGDSCVRLRLSRSRPLPRVTEQTYWMALKLVNQTSRRVWHALLRAQGLPTNSADPDLQRRTPLRICRRTDRPTPFSLQPRPVEKMPNACRRYRLDAAACEMG